MRADEQQVLQRVVEYQQALYQQVPHRETQERAEDAQRELVALGVARRIEASGR
jgi:hypothetical protein